MTTMGCAVGGACQESRATASVTTSGTTRLAVLPSWVEGASTSTAASASAPPPTIAAASKPTAPIDFGEVPGSGAPKRVYSGKRIDLDLKGVDLHDVCRL